MVRGEKGEPNFIQAAPAAPSACGDSWDDRFAASGTNGSVEAVAVDSAGNLYIAGSFDQVDNVAAKNIAKWDGSQWSPLDTGLTTPGGPSVPDGVARALVLAVHGTDLYVGGDFKMAGPVQTTNLAKWDGSSWSGFGFSTNGEIRAIGISGSDLFVGGTFSSIGGVAADRIAQWNGSSWSTLGSGVNNRINAISISGADVYVGGDFTTAGGASANRIAKWNGSSWSALGSGMNNLVSTITVSGTNVYVGGGFTTAGGVGVNHIAKWDGASWSALGSGLNNSVSVLMVSGTELYAGGTFSAAGGVPTERIAKWNGTAWSSAGSLSSTPNAFAVSGNSVYVAAGPHVRRWNGNYWSVLGPGIDGPVATIAVAGDDVYVGGNFRQVGAINANYIAKWNGNSWSALGSGVNAPVSAIAISGGDVYVGGHFSSAGGSAANYVAKWNGSSWSPLGSGVDGRILALATSGSDLYAGGDFNNAGGAAAAKIAKWNGNSWSALGSGVSDVQFGPAAVRTIAVSGSLVYAGGTFEKAGGIDARFIAKWDGAAWSPVGTGFPGGFVNAIAVSGTNVYIATNAITAGAGSSSIRMSDGGAWNALETHIQGGVHSLVIGDGSIYGGGLGYTTGPFPPPVFLQKTSGSNITLLGNDFGSTVQALALSGTDLFVGGYFQRTDCALRSYFGRLIQLQWLGGGSTGTDWHTPANWNSNTVPSAGASMIIAAGDAAISSADVTVKDLVLKNGRTLSIAEGRTLTVTGNLNLSSGKIIGPGAVMVTSCDVNAVTGGDAGSAIAAPLTRCVSGTGTFRFPVAANSQYAPVELSNVSGGGNFTVSAMDGAFSGPAGGLPANRLQHWWNLTNNGGIAQADLTFNYPEADVTGDENHYRAYRISGGTAERMPTFLTAAANKATIRGVTSFSAWTLAESASIHSTLRGQVKTASGRGAENVMMTLTDSSGNVRYGMTNQLGYYRFPNVETSRVYTLRVRSKKFTFDVPQRAIEFVDDFADQNFVSSDH